MINIVIGFSTSSKKNSIISAIIRLVERTPYSHVYVKFYSPTLDRWLVYHASHTNVHFNNIETFAKENIILEEYALATSECKKNEALRMCVDRVGRPYGYLQIFGMGIVRLIKAWFNVRLKNPFADGERTQVCSELVGHVISKLGYDINISELEFEGPRYIRNFINKTLVPMGAATPF